MTESARTDLRTNQHRDGFPDALDACGRDLERLLVTRASRTELRGPVITYVQAARKAGAPPERALAAFKMMLRGVNAIESRVSTERAELSSALVQVVIEAYYHGDSPRANGAL